MALSKKLLSRDEVVVRHMHTHIKVLLWRFVVEILLLVVGVVASVMAPTTWQPWGIVAIWVVILVVSVPLLLLPWLQWYMHTYTITTKRIITRSGIISRVGHDLPLTRISDIQLDKDVTDRFFGCGTLALQTSADDPLLLHDVPHVETVQVEISNLIFNDTQGAIDADRLGHTGQGGGDAHGLPDLLGAQALATHRGLVGRHALLAAVDGGHGQAPQLEVDLLHATGGADDVHAQAHALVLVGRAQEVARAVGDIVHRHDRGGAERGGSGLIAQVLPGLLGDLHED